MAIHSNIIIGLVVYGCLMLAMSSFWMLRVKKAVDYLVAGRGLPYWILAGTITAGCIGTGVVIGGSGLAYQHGWAGSAYPLGLGLGTLLTGWFFAHTRRYQFITLSEEISCYYNGNRAVTEFCNVSLFLSQLCWLTVQITGAGYVLGIVTGLPRELCVVLAGFVTALVAIPGGFRTIVYTDFLNSIFLLCGFSFLLHAALVQGGGFAGLRSAVPPGNFSFLGHASFGGLKLAGLLLVLVLSDVADPGRRQAIYSARTPGVARWSMVTAGAVVMVFSMVIGVVGMYAYSLNPHLPLPEQALPWLIIHVLPSWLAAIVVVSVTAAILSCANNTAAATGTFFVRHIFPLATGHYPKNTVTTARWALGGAFLLATTLALHTTSIVGFVVKFLPVTMSGLAVIILLGHFWKRANWQGALAALIATPLVSLLVLTIPSLADFWGYPAIPAVAIGILAQILVSLLTPPQPRSFVEIAEAMARERQSIEGGRPAGGKVFDIASAPAKDSSAAGTFPIHPL
jgi:SSS family solute:Na+ symporter